MENDVTNAKIYADIAVDADKYNAKALTNKGNCYFVCQNYDKAKEFYKNALAVDPLSIEPIYNLGLLCKKLEFYNESLQWFEKVHSIIRNDAETIFQISDV